MVANWQDEAGGARGKCGDWPLFIGYLFWAGVPVRDPRPVLWEGAEPCSRRWPLAPQGHTSYINPN